MKQTSRNRLIDAIEYIANLIAYSSHLQELIDWYWTNWDILLEDFHFAVAELESSIQDRRDMMQLIKDQFKGNEKIWCKVKHAIAWYWYMTEILYADLNNSKIKELHESASKRMYRTVSKFIWWEVVACWRCLSEQIEVLKTEPK